MGVIVDTAQVDPRHRVEVLRERLSSASADHEVRFLVHADRVQARLEHWPLSSEVAIMRQTSSGICHLRTARHALRDAPERIAFVVHQGGPGVYAHAGVDHELRRGGMHVTDMSAPFRYQRPGIGTAQILQIERSAVHVTAEQVRNASRRLESSSLTVLFRHHILGLIEAADELCASNLAAPVAATTLQLAECLLLDAADVANCANSDAVAATLIERIRLYVQLNYALPELDADLVAYEHHISTRYLFKLWSSQPATFSETIISTRLTAARRMLASQPRVSVAAVAHRCGFRNVSHFGRRYQAAFGQTPGQTQQSRALKEGLRRSSDDLPAPTVRGEHEVRTRTAHRRGAAARQLSGNRSPREARPGPEAEPQEESWPLPKERCTSSSCTGCGCIPAPGTTGAACTPTPAT